MLNAHNSVIYLIFSLYFDSVSFRAKKTKAQKLRIFVYFEQDAKLKRFWAILRGSPWLPMGENPFRLAYEHYFEQTSEYIKLKYTEEKDVTIRNKFPEYVQYLLKNYYGTRSRFSTSEWCHFVGTPTDLIQLTNTNLSESMNAALKSRYPRSGMIGLTRR